MQLTMLSLEVCKKILQKKGKKYSEEEIKRIRELLYQIGHLDYYLFTQKQHDDGKCDHLHKGIDR